MLKPNLTVLLTVLCFSTDTKEIHRPMKSAGLLHMIYTKLMGFLWLETPTWSGFDNAQM